MKNRGKLPRKLGLVFALMVAVVLSVGVLYDSPEPPSDAPRVLVSIDRTIWNRVGFNRFTYRRALRNAGLQPVLVDFQTVLDNTTPVDAWLDNIDGLVLSGGGDVDPSAYGNETIDGVDVKERRDAVELALLEAAERRGLPVLGICRGAQLINVYRGGSLGDFRADSERYRRHHRLRSGHPVTLDADSRLASVIGQTRLESVVTYHGQFVSEPGDGVTIVGHAPDGTPEAIEVDTGFGFGMLGVQWHAEVVPWDPHQARLFEALHEAALDYRAR